MTLPTTQTSDALRAALEQALGAQYEVVRLLGRGGMGAVYLARERLLERQVAIKVLPSETASTDARERFLREARMAAQLSHPNIVPLLSFGEMGDTLFYIMRYVEGESLEARLRREGRLPAQDVRRILTELADALAEAHRLGIVHRDLKPDNVMIERDTGRAMLTDFGIARRLESSATLTGTGVIVGSPQYMSPEQASGDRAVDGRSDIYSLGILGYRMLTGRLPFSGDSMRELLVQQITAEPASIVVHAPGAPLDLVDAITRCLAKDPARRWGDARALRGALSVSTGNALVVPEEIEGLPRWFTRTWLGGYVLTLASGALSAYLKDMEWLRIGAISSVFGPILPLPALLYRARRVGVSWKPALRMMFWPGQRSSLWWPRALRQPGDVWDRLPALVRRLRAWQSAGVVLIVGLCLPFAIGGWLVHDVSARLSIALMWGGLGAFIAGLLLVGIPAVTMLLRRNNWNLTAIERDKLFSEPTHGSSFWERPSIAALLARESAAPSDEPRSAAALAQAVRVLAAELPSVAESTGREAVAAAGDLAKELHALDKRISELAGQADPAEQARLAARLEALGAERGDEPDVSRQMRELLKGQSRLFAELDAQRAFAESRRAARFEQLRTLWLQLASYRSQLANQGADDDGLSTRIRDLCRSIERRADALGEVAGLLE